MTAEDVGDGLLLGRGDEHFAFLAVKVNAAAGETLFHACLYRLVYPFGHGIENVRHPLGESLRLVAPILPARFRTGMQGAVVEVDYGDELRGVLLLGRFAVYFAAQAGVA